MKLLIPSIMLLCSIASIGQTTKSISLSVGDCRANSFQWWAADTVLFYKLPEDTIAIRVIPRQLKQLPVKLDNIPISTYNVVFKNNFRQLVVQQVNVTDQGDQSIILCTDSSLDYSQNTLRKLQDLDTISISFHSQGCFQSTISKIVIIKKDEQFIAGIYAMNGRYVNKKKKMEMKMQDDRLLKSVVLSSENIRDFTRFENELNLVTNGGCTTRDSYDIKSKYFNKIAVDGGCSWNGYHYLVKSFFGDFQYW